MDLISIVLDLGNIVFFVSNLLQLFTAYRNRKNLKGLSSKMLFGFMISTVFFITAGVLTSAPMTIILGLGNEVFFASQLVWKWKYRNA
ncbi:MAG: hypothetical protein E3J73_05105 [Candidatus Bathyarchaeum sp.]|nr:MAG: hypothetical protein E3J73_05105 [Candidatus Bathyarchaeum sp.]